MARFVIAPQWQGSPSARAMNLVGGVEAITADLPASACTPVEVPPGAGESLGTGIRRLSSLLSAREAVRAAVAELSGSGEPVVVIGGDCSVTLGALDALARPDLAVVWLDAHADLHTPETSPSGAFGGMVLRAALGGGEPLLRALPGTLSAERVVLVGARDLDVAEDVYLAESGMPTLSCSDLDDVEALSRAVLGTGATAVYVHLDVDVLDPSRFSAVSSAVPFGADPAQLVAALRDLRTRMPLVGATISGFAPTSPDAALEDSPTVLRLIGALA